ncbi:hypothetical protein CA235_07265 [Sphingomonas sp. ABOLF]|uniref:hypothetical protein n=1 Tax=Sphingomonas sp. ABOLF TaxID=1985879 RepID=UPI000F7F0165|nr:hypothetical protein [Sphingomonas sp. ABOLF]RSV15645.1 hypothetical protein CA235_07265 [Sphingomonas sp. ABOLF]
MTDTNAMREALEAAKTEIAWWREEHDCCAGHETPVVVQIDHALALLATDRAAGVGEALRPAVMAKVVENGRWSLRFDFGKGDAACLAMRHAADNMRRSAASPPAPADASGEVETSRLVRGLQDVWEEIERLNERCFGAGSEASVSVRTSDLTEVIDVIRDNLPRNPTAGAK